MEATIMIGMPLPEYKAMMKGLMKEIFSEELSEVKKQFKEKLVTRDEAVKVLRISMQTLWRMEQRGDISPVRFGRKVMYRESELTQIINK